MREATRDPAHFPRRILLATVGLAPQIVTETLYALIKDRQNPFVPTEIHIITTKEGRSRVDLMLLDPSMAKLTALASDLERPELAATLTRERIHVIAGTQGNELADIQSEADNAATADLIIDIVRQLTADDTAGLHVSIAGGRKTMGFLLGYALSLFGRDQDRLSHVLVEQAFELHPEFFYPPRTPRVLFTRENRPINTADATIQLANIPFVRLRQGLPQQMLSGAWSYSETVAHTQVRFAAPELILDRARCMALCHGIPVALQPLPFALYAWLARRRIEQPASEAGIHWTMPAGEEFVSEYALLVGITKGQVERLRSQIDSGYIPKEKIEQNKARVNGELERRLGPLAEPYLIVALGRVAGTQYELIGLTIAAEAIRFGAIDEVPFEGREDES